MNRLVIHFGILLAFTIAVLNALDEMTKTFECNGNSMDNIDGKEFTRLVLTGQTELNNNWYDNLRDRDDPNGTKTLVFKHCVVANYTTIEEKLINFPNLKSLHLSNLDLKYFDFGSIANSVRLRQVNLDNNPNLHEVKGTCEVNLEFISLQNSGFTEIPSLLHQFDNSLMVLKANGYHFNNQLEKNFVCKSFPRLLVFNDSPCDGTGTELERNERPLQKSHKHKPESDVYPENISNYNFEDNGSRQMKPQNFIINFLLVAAFKLTFPKRYGFVIFTILMVISTCYGQTTDNQLVIQNRNINILNEDYFHNINDHSVYSEIHMEDNNILYIDINAFSAFNNLTHLYLRNNKLRTFWISATKLEVLDLSLNEIEELDQNFFEEYPLLETIKLSGNQLKHVEWNLGFHQNIKRIDLSANFELELVKIASENLEVLFLNHNKNFELNLKTANLKILDMRFTEPKPRSNIEQYCNINNIVKIYYMNRGIPDIYNCENKNIRTNTLMLKSAEFAQSFDEDSKISESERVGCEFSTLKATYGDVILSREEYTTLLVCFLMLILITIFLIISHTYLMSAYLRSKQMSEL